MSKKYIWFRNLSTEKRIDDLKKIKSNLTQLIFTKQKSTKQHINKIPPTPQASFIPSMNCNTIAFQKILIIFMHACIYSFNKFLPITNYRQNTIIKCRAYKDEKDTAFVYKELLSRKIDKVLTIYLLWSWRTCFLEPNCLCSTPAFATYQRSKPQFPE